MEERIIRLSEVDEFPVVPEGIYDAVITSIDPYIAASGREAAWWRFKILGEVEYAGQVVSAPIVRRFRLAWSEKSPGSMYEDEDGWRGWGINLDLVNQKPDILVVMSDKLYFAYLEDLLQLNHKQVKGAGERLVMVFPLACWETDMLEIYKLLLHGPRQRRLL